MREGGKGGEEEEERKGGWRGMKKRMVREEEEEKGEEVEEGGEEEGEVKAARVPPQCGHILQSSIWCASPVCMQQPYRPCMTCLLDWLA